tara:strand:- start:2903 stop:3292 length:390 start_codon:yes stop_codon:yes gene_type:complete
MGITAQAATAAAAAFDAAGDAKTLIRLQLNPSPGVFDPELDTTVVTYEQDSGDPPSIDAVPFSDKRIGDKIGQTKIGEKRTQSFLVLGSSITPTEVDQEGKIVHGTISWQIAAVESDPTKAVYIFHCLT